MPLKAMLHLNHGRQEHHRPFASSTHLHLMFVSHVFLVTVTEQLKIGFCWELWSAPTSNEICKL